MSANDNFSLHDDEELSLHDDASLNGSEPVSNKGDAPAKPPQIITTNTLSNIKRPQAVTKARMVYKDLLQPHRQTGCHEEKERKARTLLLMAVPKDHLRRFHGMDDAKEIWAAIKTRFGGNANSKKMQKAVLKQQFEAFTISAKESLEKGYDRFQKLLSQLDALGAGVSDEDANHKFLRSLPPAWDSLAMTMRTKKNIDTLSIDDLYNNLSVFEQDIQKTSSSSLTSDNVAFLSQAKASSSKHKPSLNSGSYSSYTTSSSKATPTATPGLADEVIHSFLATNADDVDLIHEDLDQIDDLDLEEMDINWQIAMTAIKIKKFYKKTGTKDGSRQEASRGQDFKPVRTEKEALMTIDEGQINWVEQTTDEEINHALMAFTVNNENWNQSKAKDIGCKAGFLLKGNHAFVCGSLSHLIKESDYYGNKWQEKAALRAKRRLGHLNFKNLNKLVKGNLVRGLPSKSFKNDHTCVACQKGKQHKASCKAKIDIYVTHPLHTLHMDLFGPTSVRSINHASYCLVITDDCSRFQKRSLTLYVADHEEAEETPVCGFSYFIKQLKGARLHALKHLGPVPTKTPTSTNLVNTGGGNVNTGNKQVSPDHIEAVSPSAHNVEEVFSDDDNDDMPEIRIYDKSSEGIFEQASYDDEGVITDFNNLPDKVDVITNPTLRIHNAHPQSQILGDPNTPVQTRSSLKKITEAHALVSYIQAHQRSNHKDQQHCLFACFLSQFEPRKVTEALEDGSWVEAMQEELLQFKLQQVWVLVDLPTGAKVIGTKWVYRNKKDERGVVVRNKARLVAQEVYVSQPPGLALILNILEKNTRCNQWSKKALYGLHQAPRAWYATLSTFLEKHGYKRGTIDKTLFIRRNENDIMLVQVYVDDIIFGSTNKSWCAEFESLMQSRFKMSSMGELTFFLGLQVKQNKEGIFISQDKYVAEILKKFDLVHVKAAITPMETKMPLTKDEEAFDVDVHLYRSMIGSLMYLTASRPDIMYAVCVCSRFQVTPKTSHLNVVKRIFKYLKGKPNLGLWYPRESPFDLEAFSDSDYGGSNLDRKSTTGGCQFLGQRLISWQCKKQTIVATSTTEAEYVAAANCCGQVLWVQNQLLDYGFNFMNTKIHIDNESTICIVKNPVYHSKTKHIEIRHHFIRDCYEKKLISVEKIHTDLNVADLLTKPFDGPRFNYLVVSIGIAWMKGRSAKYCDKHNQVGFLRKPDESAGFAEIVDFLRGSNLRYALTANPTIYDSLVKQFWQSATANTKADGSLEINATIDTIRYTISEASIRDSLQLEDATRITMLLNDELFEGMGQTGTRTLGCGSIQPSHHTLSQHQYHYLYYTHPHLSQHQYPTYSYTYITTPTPPATELQQLELDLKTTKLNMGNAIVKLVKKVKKLEGFMKRRNLVLTDSEEEEPEAQGRKSQDDPQDSSVQGLGHGSKSVRKLSFEEVKKEFDKLVKQVESFAPISFEATKDSLKRFGEELQTKTPKRLKEDND
ncbi:putative ribonuclease H-like domain-containing protein [Tanacetum coccineum]